MIDLKRKVIRPVMTSANVSYDSAIIYNPPIVDVITSEVKVVNNKRLFNVSRDIKLLLSQEKFNNLSIDALKEYFATHSDNTTIQNLRAKCADEDLLKMCKSRYLQRTSELQSYFDYLESNFDAEYRNITNIIKAQADEGIGSSEANGGA